MRGPTSNGRRPVGPLPLDALDLDPSDVRARLREARDRGQPFFPWPDLSPGDWRRSLAAVGSTVAEVLRRDADGCAPASAPVSLAAPAGARALGIAAFTSGTGPLLGRWIEDRSVAADDDAARLLLLHLEHGRRRAARLETRLGHVLGALAAAGVEPTVIKGLHTGRAFFPEPGARPLADLDLVVEAEEIPSASGALAAAGLIPRPTLQRPYMCEWTPPDVPPVPVSLELTHQANPWSVDLHGSFERDFGGVRRLSVVPSASEATVRWDGVGRARVLRQPYLTAYLALHASQELKNLMLVRLFELVLVIRGGLRDGSFSWGSLRALLESRDALPFVYPAFALAERLAPGTVPRDFLSASRASTNPRVRKIVDELSPATAQRLESVDLREQFMWARSPRDHVRRGWRALWPAWAGSAAGVLRVQATRLRQLVKRRVGLGGSR